MLNKDAVIGVVLMSISAAFFGVTWTFPIQGQYVSPAVFPRFVSACMLILAGILVARNMKAPSTPETQERDPDTTGITEKIRSFVVRNSLFFLFAIIAFTYTRVIDYVGFIPSTLFLLAATVFLFKERRWYVIALVSVLGTSVYYYVFRIIFKVPLPRFDLF